VTGN
jgi:hypothetical protein